jgi:hypothetical protein
MVRKQLEFSTIRKQVNCDFDGTCRISSRMFPIQIRFLNRGLLTGFALRLQAGARGEHRPARRLYRRAGRTRRAFGVYRL